MRSATVRPSLGVIFLTVFIDLVGFGLVIPLLPSYSRDFGATGLETGLLFGVYSLMQLIFAPWWGALSDRIGRRPVLLVSIAAGTLAYALFAVASGLTGRSALLLIVASRMFAGICGANITVAQAYIADITPPAERSKRMGLIGMAFGLGFTVGPGLAALALRYLGPTGPGWIATMLCAVNLLFAWQRLPESWEPGRTPARPRPRFDQIRLALARPFHGFLILTFALATFGFTCFESTLGLLIQQNFTLARDGSATTNAILFCFCGIVGAAVQGGAIGRLIKKLGEARLIALSLVIFGLSMLPLPFIHGTTPLSWNVLLRPEGTPWILLLVSVAWLSIGSALTRPPLFGLLSSLTPPEEQGATLGVAQSAGSLARVIGPPWAGFLFDRHASWPYLACAALGVGLGLIAWRRLVGRIPTSAAPAPTATA